MVIEFNRLLSGILLIIVLLTCFFFKLDYLILILLSTLIIYDLYKSNFINVFYDYILIAISIFTFFFIYDEIKLVNILNVIFIICILLNIFFINFYFNKIFVLSILIFLLNLYTVFIFDRDYLYFVIFISFFNDTIAYITGKSIKGPLIIPSISPNKTWSGTLISFFLTLLLLYKLDINFFVGILLSSSLFFGDIFFSYVKRKKNIKDFSSLIKGHGGILDRLDSMFFFTIILNFYFLI